MKTKNEIKIALASLVVAKMEATRARVAYKRSLPPSAERGAMLQGFWRDCRSAKYDARYMQLAYALVRGRAYWTQERHCNLNNEPSAYLLSQVAGCTKEEAKAWLDMPVPEAETVAFAAHLQKAKEKWCAGRLASKLDRLIADGKGDTDEADDIRQSIVDRKQAREAVPCNAE